jgi:uncharacterized protein (TIGR02118 family)
VFTSSGRDRCGSTSDTNFLLAAFQAGFGPHAKEIVADIPNYTDQTPVIQISDVVVGFEKST